MSTDTHKSIINNHDERFDWQQPFILHTDGVKVNLSVAIGENATNSPNITANPKSFPKTSHYMFDPTKYCGEASFKDISTLIHS